MKNSFQVIFSLKRLDSSTLPSNAIQLYPGPSNWNDFGHQTHFHVVLPSEKHPDEIRLSFLNTDLEPYSYIKNRLQEKISTFIFASDVDDFFTMRYEINDYRSVVSKYGSGDAIEILLALNDLVAVRKYQPNLNWYHQAIKTRAFSLSFLRNSSSVYAFYNAGSILSGLHFEDLKSAPRVLKLDFRLNGFLSNHSFSFNFNFESIVPKRLCVLIGKNGVGKSQTLRKIVDFSINGDSSFRGNDGTLPKVSQIIAICTPGETYSTFPAATENPRTKYTRLTALPDELENRGGQTLPEIIVQMARDWERSIGANSRWEIFEKAIQKILPINEIAVMNRSAENSQEKYAQDFVYILALARGGEQKSLEAMRKMDKSGTIVRICGSNISPLSSGQQSFLRLAAQLSVHIENGSLVLIDEPETHLHPNLITQFVAFLSEILELSGSIGIAATHSAYLVREVPRSQVFIIQEKADRTIEITTPRLRTFGADVGAISSFIFNDGITNKLIDDVVERIKYNPTEYSNWKTQLIDELSPEAAMIAIQRLDNEFGEL